MGECHATIHYHQFEHKWTLADFTLYKELATAEKGTAIRSPSFSAGDENNTKWCTVFKYEFLINGAEHFWFRLFYEKDNKQANILASCTGFLVNDKNERVKLFHSPIKNFAKTHDPNLNFGSGMKTSVKDLLNDTKSCLPNDRLTIIFQIKIINPVPSTTTSCTPTYIRNDILNDVAKLLTNKNFADVTFILRNNRIKAHKNILAARSPVFAAMFQHQMREQIKNEVHIPDIEPKIFEQMLQFIYTNVVTDIDCMAMDLLAVAEKYDLQMLKEMCGESLCKTITVDNAAATFMLADRHNINTLMECTQIFISSHIVDVIETPGYQTMEKENLKCATKLLRASMTKKFTKN